MSLRFYWEPPYIFYLKSLSASIRSIPALSVEVPLRLYLQFPCVSIGSLPIPSSADTRHVRVLPVLGYVIRQSLGLQSLKHSAPSLIFKGSITKLQRVLAKKMPRR